MRSADCIPLFLFGALLGALVASVSREPGIYVPSLIVATTAMVVGWWVQGALRRRGDLDKIPVDYLSNLVSRIDELTVRCLEQPQVDERLVKLGSLGNEIHILCGILKDMDGVSESTPSSLELSYFEFKKHLTGPVPARSGYGARASSATRRARLIYSAG